MHRLLSIPAAMLVALALPNVAAGQGNRLNCANVQTMTTQWKCEQQAHPSVATFYLPQHNQACRAHYVRRVVRVRKRSHGHVVRNHGRVVWVRQVRCVYATAVATPVSATTPTPPTVRAGIDPSYTQDPNDNLRVTWTYGASATGALPPGTLSLSVQEPNKVGSAGGCTINVGDTVTGGTCTQELPHYGPWNVTVSYAGASTIVAPASSTDTEDIEPLKPFGPIPTTTTLTTTQVGNETDYAANTQDSNGSVVGSAVEWVVGDATTGGIVGTFYNVTPAYFKMVTIYNYVTHQPDGQAIAAYHVGQSAPVASGDIVNPQDTFTVQAVSAPVAAYAGSSSQATPLALTP